MTGNVAFDSLDNGALPGRSTTMVYTLALVAASASMFGKIISVLITEKLRSHLDQSMVACDSTLVRLWYLVVG